MTRATQESLNAMGRGDATEAQPSYLAPDLIIRGRVTSGGEVFVAGRVEGDVACATLSVAMGGTVDGTVRAQRVNLESGAGLAGEVVVDVLGVKGDADLTARVVCQGAPRREASREVARQDGKALDALPVLSRAVPAE